jgi:N-methylhydantoinase A
MNAFASSAHERAQPTPALELGDAWVSPSHEVLPTIRFYDRVSTTVLDAYTGPVLGRYLESLMSRLAEASFGGVLLVMQSSGGVSSAEQARKRPSTTLLSGPAAGPGAAHAVAAPLGSTSCLVVDMGGTSFDASLVKNGDVALKAQGEIARLRTALPMLDIVTIGAGGGSIGWIDPGGLLRMGPQSAGADPGPACYGRGGELPACTDADWLLGYLDPERFAGGALRLDALRAKSAVEKHVARPLGLSVDEAAAGMYRVINTNMAHGVRQITVQRGSITAISMVVAGRALHAGMIALGSESPRSWFRRSPHLVRRRHVALGLHDFVRSFVGPLAALDCCGARWPKCSARRGGAGAKVCRRPRGTRADARPPVLEAVPRGDGARAPEALDAADLERIGELFHAEHDRLYGYQLAAEKTPLELINLRVRSIGRVDKPPLPKLRRGGPDAEARRARHTPRIRARAQSFREIAVYDGHAARAKQAEGRR